MMPDGVLSQRSQLPDELSAHRHGEGRRDADVLQDALLVIQTEEQRANRIPAGSVPAKARYDAVRRAHVLDLDQCAFARLVEKLGGLGDHTVQTGAFETLQPRGRLRPVARHGREIDLSL